MARFLKPASLVVLLISPVLIHMALFHSRSSILPLAFLVLQFAGLGLALMGQVRGRAKRLVAAFMAILVGGVAWRFDAEGIVASSGVTHAVVHSALIVFFGGSLLKGREPLVTIFMRRIRGTLQPELVRYGRQVTILWCICSAAQLATSAALLLTAPLATWSFFINVLSLPLVFLVFAGEIVYHTVRFRHLPRSRLTDLVKVVAAWRATPGSTEKTVAG